MYQQSAEFYDKVYSFKDYRAESEKLIQFIENYLKSSGRKLLDVACGTGRHIEILKQNFLVEGLDLDQNLLDIARRRNPEIVFHHASMMDFTLPGCYDVITCLFSAIGYALTIENLQQAYLCMARHLLPGGVLLVEPWFTPDTWKSNTVHALLVDEPDLKIARVNTSFTRGRLSIFDFHYLVGTPQGTSHFTEYHELGLFTIEEHLAALRKAGLEPFYDEKGTTGRGIYIAAKPRDIH